MRKIPNHKITNIKWFDRLTVLSRVEGLTTLSKVEGQPAIGWIRFWIRLLMFLPTTAKDREEKHPNLYYKHPLLLYKSYQIDSSYTYSTDFAFYHNVTFH